MLYLVFCSLVWAFSYGLIKGNLTSLSPDFVACMRMLVPSLLFLPWLRISSLPGKKDMGIFLLIGAVQYGIMYLCVIRSYAFLPAHHVVLFTAFTPLYVTLLSDLTEGSFRPFFVFTSLLALVGVTILYWHQLPTLAACKGFLLVQLSDLCFAFGQVAYKRARKHYPMLKDQSIYALLFLGGLAVTALSTTLLQGWSSYSVLTTKQLFLLLYLGAIASGLCFFLWNKAAVTTSIGSLAVINNVKIPLGVLVSLLFFHETAHIPSLTFSLTLVIVALILAEKFSRQKQVLTS